MGRTHAGYGARGRAVAALFGAGLLALGCQNGPYLQTEQYVTNDGREDQVGVACMSVEKGSGMGGGRAPGVPGAAGDGGEEGVGHSFSYDGTGNSVRLRVVDVAGKTLVDKNYDGAFIDSGRKDEVTVDTGRGTARFVAWGVPQCGATK